MGFHVIGVGPGDSELMTMKAVRLIKEADVIIAPVKKEGSTASTALSIAQPYVTDQSKVVFYHFPMVHGFNTDSKVLEIFENYGAAINKLVDEGKKVVFLTLGDPSIYSTYTYVNKHINSVAYVPGIPSFINGAALGKMSLCIGDESLCVLNMTDNEEELHQKFKLHESIVVMKVCVNQPLLKSLLIKGNRTITLMSNIGLENEAMTTDIDALDNKLPYFTIGIVR